METMIFPMVCPEFGALTVGGFSNEAFRANHVSRTVAAGNAIWRFTTKGEREAQVQVGDYTSRWIVLTWRDFRDLSYDRLACAQS
jgi:hypothetical protein